MNSIPHIAGYVLIIYVRIDVNPCLIDVSLNANKYRNALNDNDHNIVIMKRQESNQWPGIIEKKCQFSQCNLYHPAILKDATHNSGTQVYTEKRALTKKNLTCLESLAILLYVGILFITFTPRFDVIVSP